MYPSRDSIPANHKLNLRLLALRYPQALVSQKDRKALYRVAFESRKITLWASCKTIVAIQTDKELLCDKTKYSLTTTKHCSVIFKEACFGTAKRTIVHLEPMAFAQALLNLSLESGHDNAN